MARCSPGSFRTLGNVVRERFAFLVENAMGIARILLSRIDAFSAMRSGQLVRAGRVIIAFRCADRYPAFSGRSGVVYRLATLRVARAESHCDSALDDISKEKGPALPAPLLSTSMFGNSSSWCARTALQFSLIDSAGRPSATLRVALREPRCGSLGSTKLSDDRVRMVIWELGVTEFPGQNRTSPVLLMISCTRRRGRAAPGPDH